MFGLFKNKPIEDIVTATGPDFSKAIQFEIDFSGSKFNISAPKHNAEAHFNPCDPKTSYDLTTIQLPFSSSDGNNFLGLSILRKNWRFIDIKTREKLALCTLNLSIESEFKKDKNISYFHPRTFENVIANRITFRHGIERTHDDRQFWLAPTDWNESEIGENRFAFFKVIPQPDIKRNENHIYFLTPISDNHFITLWIEISWKKATKEFEEKHGKDKEMVNTSEVEKLIDNIISSVNLELSPEAMLAKAKATEGLDDISLVKEFPPIKWDPPTKTDEQ